MRNHSLSSLYRGMAAVVGIALVAACSGGGDGSPTGPQTAPFVLESATVSVGGQVVNGMTLEQGRRYGSSTRFEARVMDLGGRPSIGETVRMRYQRPQGGGMMGGPGTVRLYDDGTHGDLVPGDGLYCLEDWDGDYGCHRDTAPPGDYRYEFWCEDGKGRESGHLTIAVTVQ